jgi:ADP-ribose pyrophosphatase
MNRSGRHPIRRVERRQVFANRWLTVYEDRTDVSGEPGLYSVLSRPDAVAVVVTSVTGTLLMLDSFRYPTGQFSLELPMGAIESGESPETAARRELREETGLVSERLGFDHLGWFFALPGLSGQKVHVFASIAAEHELRSACVTESEPDLTGVVLVRVDELPALAAAGKLTDSVTLCSLLLSGLSLRAAGQS